MTARPKTLIQPNATARPGANSAANTVPELPAPAMPSAVPWCSGGYHRDANGRATAKDAPATPRMMPASRIPAKSWMSVSQMAKRPDQHDRLGDQSRKPRLEMVDHDAEDHADYGAGEDGHGDHQALLRVVEPEVGCDLDAERPEHHPDHERYVEVEERSEQRRRITRPEERLVDHRNRSRAPHQRSGSK